MTLSVKNFENLDSASAESTANSRNTERNTLYMVLILIVFSRLTQISALEIPIRQKIGTGNSPNHEAWHWRCSEHSHAGEALDPPPFIFELHGEAQKTQRYPEDRKLISMEFLC